MRTKNTILNSGVTLTFQIVTLLIGFVLPRWIISVYGSEVNGLTSNITQVINVINLLQAGLVGASIFEMYKPITEDNYEVIGSIFYSSGKYFEKMSFCFFALTLLMIPYLLYGGKSSISSRDIVLSVIILGINATLIFRCFCKYDVIFSAYQKKYILIISSFIERFIYYVLLFVILHFKLYYLWMYIAILVGSLCKLWYIRKKFKHDYYNNIKEYRHCTDYCVKNQWQLFGNQVIQNLIESMPIVFVTLFNGLKYASVLSVYLIVVNFFKMIFSTLQNSVAASFGDLAAAEDGDKIIEIFGLIQMLFSAMMIVVFFCLCVLYLSFIDLYMNGAADFSYVFPGLAISMIFYMACNFSFLSYNLLINSLGLFGKVLKTNIVLGGTCLCIIVLFSAMDFQYVYIAPAIFYGSSIIHRHLFLKKWGIRISRKNFSNAVFPIIITIPAILLFVKMPLIGTLRKWILTGIISFMVSCAIVFFIAYVFRKDELLQIKEYVLSVMKREYKAG